MKAPRLFCASGSYILSRTPPTRVAGVAEEGPEKCCGSDCRVAGYAAKTLVLANKYTTSLAVGRSANSGLMACLSTCVGSLTRQLQASRSCVFELSLACLGAGPAPNQTLPNYRTVPQSEAEITAWLPSCSACTATVVCAAPHKYRTKGATHEPPLCRTLLPPATGNPPHSGCSWFQDQRPPNVIILIPILFRCNILTALPCFLSILFSHTTRQMTHITTVTYSYLNAAKY